MKFVLTNGQSSFKFFQRKKEGDGEEYSYLQSTYQIRGYRKIHIVLYNFSEKKELLEELRQYRNEYNEIFYELSSLI